MESENAEIFFSGLQKYRTENKVVEFYDEYAKNYDKTLESYGYINITKYSATFLKNFLLEEKLSLDDCEILDVGCGSGLTGEALQKAGFHTFDGVDASQGVLDVANEKKIYRNLSRGKLTETENFDIDDGKYDALLCIGCISADHINVKQAIPEFHRLLKHGGIAVYTISPVGDKTKALEKHLQYFYEEKYELLAIERKYYVDQMNGAGSYCHLYGVKKL